FQPRSPGFRIPHGLLHWTAAGPSLDQMVTSCTSQGSPARPPRLRKATYVVPAGTGVQYDWKRAGFVRCWRWSCAGCQEAPPSKLTWMSEPRAAKRRRAPSLHHPLVPAQVGDLGVDPPQVVRRHAELDVRAGDTQLERVAAGGTGHEHALVAGGG